MWRSDEKIEKLLSEIFISGSMCINLRWWNKSLSKAPSSCDAVGDIPGSNPHYVHFIYYKFSTRGEDKQWIIYAGLAHGLI